MEAAAGILHGQERRGATLSGFMRFILGTWLEENGDPVEWVIEWGGERGKEQEGD